MAVITRKELECRCLQRNTRLEHGLFGSSKEIPFTAEVYAQIHTYYVHYKDDNDETLHDMIDSLNRLNLDIGTQFDKLALKAFKAQPEYVCESIHLYSDKHREGSFKIGGNYYRLIAYDDSLELMPLYYWMHRNADVIHTYIGALDSGDITPEVLGFIDRARKTYTKYANLYKTRKEK